MSKASLLTLRPWLLAAVLVTTGSGMGLSTRAEAQTLRPATPPTAGIATLGRPVPTQPSRRSSRDLAPGMLFEDDCLGCPEMVVMPAGEFLMGSPVTEVGRDPNEGPQRLVQVGSFTVMIHEVTRKQWDRCVQDGACRAGTSTGAGYDEGWDFREHQGIDPGEPVVNVSYLDATAYSNWLSRITGEDYRLLAEAEWEYAARAGTTTPWATGDALRADDANFAATGHGRPLGPHFPANAFGLYNMHGNVWEWVSDCNEPQGLRTLCPNWRYVVRGGSFTDEAKDLRSASRRAWDHSVRLRNVGFRLARSHSDYPLTPSRIRRGPAAADLARP